MGFRVPPPVARPCLNVPRGRIGLYDPTYEHDACGVAMVAKLDAVPTHETVERAIVALENLEHRGAAGADPNTGDGAGILLQLPDEFLRGVIDAELPPPGAYGVCVCFLPREQERREELERAAREDRAPTRASASSPGATCRWTRTTSASRPTSTRRTSSSSSSPRPTSWRRPGRVRAQALRDPARGRDRRRPGARDPELLEPHDRLQGHAHQPAAAGLLPRPAGQADEDARWRSSTRGFSTNTFPSWELAHPYRMIAHNGEINTLRGNINWMRARESQLASELFGDDLPEGAPGRPRRAAATARRSTTCSSCSCSPAAASRTR